DELDQIVADAGGVVVKLAVLLRRGPFVPSILAAYDRGVVFTIELGTITAFGFKVVQIFQEQHPRSLFHVVEFVCDAFFCPKIALDLVECVLVQIASCHSFAESSPAFLSWASNRAQARLARQYRRA